MIIIKKQKVAAWPPLLAHTQHQTMTSPLMPAGAGVRARLRRVSVGREQADNIKQHRSAQTI